MQSFITLDTAVCYVNLCRQSSTRVAYHLGSSWGVRWQKQRTRMCRLQVRLCQNDAFHPEWSVSTRQMPIGRPTVLASTRIPLPAWKHDKKYDRHDIQALVAKKQHVQIHLRAWIWGVHQSHGLHFSTANGAFDAWLPKSGSRCFGLVMVHVLVCP